MPTTTNRGYASPAHGGAVDTWDADLNAIFSQIDKNLGAVSTVALTNANVILNAAQYVCGTIRFTGTLGADPLITFPSVSGWWTIDNQTVGGTHYIILSCGGGEIIGIPPHESIDVFMDGTNVRFRNLGRVGSYLDLATTSVPRWITGCSVPPYLICDGSAFNAATYPALATLLGGNTLPDTRGRSRIALNGGTGRVTNAGSGIDGDTILAAGGAQDVTLGIGEIPAHDHGVTDPGHDHGVAGGTRGGTTALASGASPPTTGVGGGADIDITPNTTGISIQNAGGGGAHNNMQPTYVGGLTLIRAG